MSRFVEFELRMRGKKSDCKKFEEIMGNYERYATDSFIIEDGGDEKDFIEVVKAACSSSVYLSMIAPENNNLQAASKDLSLEIEVYGGDIGDGDEFEHYHYKSGECIDCFCLPSCFREGSDYDLSDEDIKKYELRDNGLYVIKNEFIPKARWSDEDEFGEQSIEAEFSIPLPNGIITQ